MLRVLRNKDGDRWAGCVEQALKTGPAKAAGMRPFQKPHLAIQIRLDAHRSRRASHHRLAARSCGQQLVKLRPYGVGKPRVQARHVA
jgi:hypothetical protein